MRFIKNHVYACTFSTAYNDAVFYGIYTHTDMHHKWFKYISNVNYGYWHADTFSCSLYEHTTFADLGTIKQNPELFI